MPATPKYRLNNPYFNEYVFHLIVNAPRDLLNKLPVQLLRHTTSPEKIKAFAVRASFEKKQEMISRLGGALSVTVAPPDWLNQARLDEVLENFKSNNRLEDVNAMLSEKVFTYTSREVMAIHTIMAMNCHSETYMLNRDYDLIATRLAKGDFDTKIKDFELLKETMADQKMLCKLLLYNLRDQNFVDGTTGFKARELMILLYLFLNRNKFVEAREVQTFFQTIYSEAVVSTSLYNMVESRHVQRLSRSYKYTIAELGIGAIGSYMNRMLNLVLSF